MMLKRKANDEIARWHEAHRSKALLVTGARQVGKTYLIEQFAREHYEHFVKFDLVNQTDVRDALNLAKSSAEVFLTFSAFAGSEMVPGSTLIFIDEVQECKEAITFIKYLVQREGFDYMLSGSLLGVELQDVRSLPVGYLSVMEMFPLDFEEFTWALGIGGDVWESVRASFEAREAIFPPLHDRLLALFHQYLIVGGMPAAVADFVQSQNYASVKRVQDDILALYRMDVAKYAQGDTLWIKEIFDQIPSQLDTQSKRFSFASLKKGGTYDDYVRDFLWLTNAGVALPVRVVKEPRHPLKLAENRRYFKLFMNDVGLLAAASGLQVAKSIVSDDLGVNYGSIYENVVAQELRCHGFSLYYFRSKGVGELDFVIELEGGAVMPIEVKSGKNYRRHVALDNVLSSPNYHIAQALVLCEENLRVEGKIAYCPAYCTALLAAVR